ncbi:MAG: carbamoyltransferase HypF [Gammaproteobacteria bacterium]|nr:carbamoyltransferase HypF [Gammaproteobacteria bacterium]
MKGEEIRVSGIVQGVGFRPTVWTLAHESGLVGQVWNDSEGVLIHIWGSVEDLDNFAARLESEVPPLAQIDCIQRTPLELNKAIPSDFQIIISQSGLVNTRVASDAATCPECLEEVFDPSNRRYRYPFTNCTHCGPRMSIIKSIPYDRANTSMSAFQMCPQCQNEYDDPADRRFHAQPNACHKCGPKIWLEDRQGNRVYEKSDVIDTAADLIRQGKIVAIKGIGGIHLACDATNHSTVQNLRQRKHRYQKPFALMAKNMTMVKTYANVNEVEEQQLNSRSAPIVILKTVNNVQIDDALLAESLFIEELSVALAPGQNSLGFMLPYTPLHHLLMQNMVHPIVLTSANQSDEPQVTRNGEAHQRLDQIADYYLMHDRDIVNRLDDSVVRLMDDESRFLRLARGYAPMTLALPDDFPDSENILAMGGELKNTFCLLKKGKVNLSQYIGDLENAATFQDYKHNLLLYQQLFDFKTEVIAVDMHPNYLSTQLGQQMAAEDDIKLFSIQHHHAHIASCMLEHGLAYKTQAVLGIALDGLGYGMDKNIWGGEFLLANYHECQRLAYFQPTQMLGGAQAMHEPWRNTLAYLLKAFDWGELTKKYSHLEIIRFLKTKPIKNLQIMAEKGLNSPNASSAGRLFDAVAAALGVCCEHAAYEGQAAIELEALASLHFDSQAEHAYGFNYQEQQIIWQPMWTALLDDLSQNIEPAIIAARFHHCVAQAVAQTAVSLCAQKNIQTVVLSGGVFQNALLLERTSLLLREQQLTVLSPLSAPMNDAGLSIGQAAIALALSHQE